MYMYIDTERNAILLLLCMLYVRSYTCLGGQAGGAVARTSGRAGGEARRPLLQIDRYIQILCVLCKHIYIYIYIHIYIYVYNVYPIYIYI